MNSILLSLALATSVVNAAPVQVSNVLVAPRFCEGIRSAEPDAGMTYKTWLGEFALDTTAAQKIEEKAYSEEIKAGQTNTVAAKIAAKKRADAKARHASIASGHVRSGQKYLCGQESNNW